MKEKGFAEEDLETESACNTWVRVGACTACGPRPSNEDQHIMLYTWHTGGAAGLYAVFDGHGGPAVSILASKLLSKALTTELQIELNGIPAWSSSEGRRAAVEQAFKAVDLQLSSKAVAEPAGSTCIAALVWPIEQTDKSAKCDFLVLLANLGDSRGVVVRGSLNSSITVGELLGETLDHKPDCPAEMERIQAAGGVVTGIRNRSADDCARVDGDLATSRSFGDFRLKSDRLPQEQQKVSPMPDVYEFCCRGGDRIVLACDGAFDVLSSCEVASLVCQERFDQRSPEDHSLEARLVVQEALSRGTQDNVTCVVIHLLEVSSLENIAHQEPGRCLPGLPNHVSCNPSGAPPLEVGLRRGEEGWQIPFEKLNERFPEVGPSWVAQALRENDGHAGKAAAKLRLVKPSHRKEEADEE